MAKIRRRFVDADMLTLLRSLRDAIDGVLAHAPGGDAGSAPRLFLELARVQWGKSWVAELIVDARGGTKRAFLEPRVDYSRANKTGTSGVYQCYALAPGRVYEVSDPGGRPGSDRRFVCQVEDGKLVKLSAKQSHEALT